MRKLFVVLAKTDYSVEDIVGIFQSQEIAEVVARETAKNDENVMYGCLVREFVENTIYHTENGGEIIYRKNFNVGEE